MPYAGHTGGYDDRRRTEAARKPLFWVVSSRKDYNRFPLEVREEFDQALDDARLGGKHPAAKPLKGFKGAGVLEAIAGHEGSTYRVVYTVKFRGVVYAVHAFQKKSRRASKTPLEEIRKVQQRLKYAEEHYAHWHAEQNPEK